MNSPSVKCKDLAAYRVDVHETGYAFVDGLPLEDLSIEKEIKTELDLKDANGASVGDDDHGALHQITYGDCNELCCVRLGRGVKANIPPPPGLYSDDGTIEEGVVCYIPSCTSIFTHLISQLNHLKNQHGALTTIPQILWCANVECLKICSISDMKCCTFCRRWECKKCSFWCTRCRFQTVCCRYHWQNGYNGKVQIWCIEKPRKKGKGIYQCLRCYKESY